MSTPKPEAAPGSARRTGRLAALVVLFLLPLALRALPIEHGFPRNYVPDAHVVRSALGMAKEKNPVPPSGKYSSYPYLVPYMLLPAYATQFVAGKLTGEWEGADGYADFLYEHPESPHRIARWLVAILGALTPWVVFRAARAAGLERGAWVAAWLVGTSLLHLHFSVQERPWVPMLLFTALALWPAARYVRHGGTRRLVLSGMAGGLAFACHQSGLPVLGIAGLAWAIGPPGWRSGKDLARRVGVGAAAVAAFGVVALLLGHPYILIYGNQTTDAAMESETALRVGGQGINLGFRLASFPHLAKAFFGYDPVLVVLGVGGLFLLRGRRALWPAGIFCAFWGLFFMTQFNDHVRYVLPLTALLALPAGLAAERFLDRAPRAAWATPLLVALLAIPLVQALRFDWLLAQPDTRVDAERLVHELLPPDALLALDRYAPPIEPNLASLERTAALREAAGGTLYGREQYRLEQLLAGTAADPGIDRVAVEDYLAIDERDDRVEIRENLRGLYGDDPTRLLTELGATHLLFVNRIADGAQGHTAPEWIAGREPLFVVNPCGEGATVDEARLPMEMEFAFTAIWRMQRPGPWIALYDLR
ncbi:MAG: glycosyltransferase family 39 protein [Planctomycetes bacterium]|nr:glycosyltransferase family 39 protein [Planctomycetota bacterium]MCB9905382.1 glycosyltransferase family 39 protein [Planctomycetota bacterium]